MNAIAKTEQTALATMSEGDLLNVLGSSLYPGANHDSIKMVLGYCKAAGLDPMQKPVHIVPMDVKVNGQFQKVDVVMPGIGLYRTQAARTGAYAGVSEPEFGPTRAKKVQRKQFNNAHRDDKTFTMVDDGEMEYPEWCKVTVKRLLGSQTVEFTAIEYWLENYATAGKDSSAPNAMWKKRPYGQLAKCTEAQALRKAFPEVGNEPTADEMAGKALNEYDTATVIDGSTGEIVSGKKTAEKPTLPAYTSEQFDNNMVTWTKVIKSGKKTVDEVLVTIATIATLTEDQTMAIRAIPAEIVKAAGQRQSEGATGPVVMTYAHVAAKLNAAGADLDKLAEAGSLIEAVADESQRKELGALYDRLTEFI